MTRDFHPRGVPDEQLAWQLSDALKKADPAPDHGYHALSAAKKATAEHNLARIMNSEGAAGANVRGLWGNRQRRFIAVAAAVVVIAVGGLSLPSLIDTHPAQASAAEVLRAAAVSVGQQPEAAAVAITSNDYLRRVDKNDSGEVITQYEVAPSGDVTPTVTVKGTIDVALTAIADNPAPVVSPESVNTRPLEPLIRETFGSSDGEKVRGALSLLLIPGVHSHVKQKLYEYLAAIPGNELAHVKSSQTRVRGDDEIVSVIRERDQLSFDLLPATGQLVRVTGLYAGVETTVDAAGILDCVRVSGLDGPENLSLSCADGNYTINDISWNKWGGDQAIGHGTAWINDCKETCAEGKFHSFPVTLTAHDKRRCGYNLDVYTKLDLDYGRQESAPDNETIPITCAADFLNQEQH